ncbi:hypothetical protein [Microbacterium sp. PMB16]|uniref:hypothetical protein n=1 Tax=Microbacterium sp. PMB16 TaxID=3120157 RepID=UPI003F4BF107
MDARATRRGVPAVVIWGGFGALAWATLTLLTGGGAAHADEKSDGPLDGLTSIVNETVSAVTAPVTPVVTQVVAPVVKTVVAPVQQAAPAVVHTVTQTVAKVPVAGAVAAPVVKAVTDTAKNVVAPVTEVLTDSPVAQITDPVVDAVKGLPVVGELVDDLGAIDLIDDVVGVVDDTAGVIGGVIDETVPPVLEAVDPAAPGETDGPDGSTGPGDRGAPDSAAAHRTFVSLSSLGVTSEKFTPELAGIRPVFPAATPADSAGEFGALGAPSGVPGGAPPGAPFAPSSSAGPGGASVSALARISDVGAPSLRAWERVSGASDDALPTSPVADTDVSPD